jgi:hypothetical protein
MIGQNVQHEHHYLKPEVNTKDIDKFGYLVYLYLCLKCQLVSYCRYQCMCVFHSRCPEQVLYQEKRSLKQK